MKYTEKQQWALNQVEILAEELGSIAKACRKIGISQPVYTQLKSMDYRGNSDNQLAKIIAYFDTKAESADVYHEIRYAPTSISTAVYKTIRAAHLRGGFVIATGDAGIGKTKAIQQYRNDYPEQTITITVNPCCKSTKSMLKLIAAELNVPSLKSIDELWMAITAKLHDGMVIIADEGQLLTYHSIETLRSFSDYFDSQGQTVGVAIIGNNGIREKIEGKAREQYRQVNNRTWQRPMFATKDITLADMSLLFPLIADCAAELKFLHKIAQSPEGVRGAVRLFSNAYDNERYDLQGLAATAKAMRIDIRITKEDLA